jgi:RNA polymerase sigma-70 factor (ECF subfamily)
VAFGRDSSLAELRARNPAALRAVVDQHARRLYRAARGMGFSPDDAEDLAQEVFVTFLETLERFEGRSELGTWLFGVLHHKAQERRRAQRAARQVSASFDQELPHDYARRIGETLRDK